MSKRHYEVIDFDEFDTGVYSEKDEYTFDKIDTSFGKQHRKDKVIKVILIILSLYLAFLIVGLSVTNFYVKEQKQQAIYINYAYIKDKDDFDDYKKQIKKIRELYVDITILDIKTANEEITYAKAAQNYSSLLEELDKLIPKIQAMDVEDANELIRTKMSTSLQENVGHYLIYMSDGLLSENNDTVTTAIQYRELMFEDYDNIMKLMSDMANNLHLQDDTFFEWNLNDAVVEKDPTAILKS